MNVNNNPVGKGGLPMPQGAENQPIVPNGGNQGNVVQVEGESPIQTSSNEENPEVTLDQRNVHTVYVDEDDLSFLPGIKSNLMNDSYDQEAFDLLNKVVIFVEKNDKNTSIDQDLRTKLMQSSEEVIVVLLHHLLLKSDSFSLKLILDVYSEDKEKLIKFLDCGYIVANEEISGQQVILNYKSFSEDFLTYLGKKFKVTTLAEKGDKDKTQNATMLMQSVFFANKDCVQLILDTYKSLAPDAFMGYLEAKLFMLDSALDIALNKRDKDILDLILDAYGPAKCQDELTKRLTGKHEGGNIMLYNALKDINSEFIDFVLWVYEKIDPAVLLGHLECKDDKTNTVLHRAVMRSDPYSIYEEIYQPYVDSILDAYKKVSPEGLLAYLKTKNNEGDTALHVAAVRDTDALRQILDYAKKNLSQSDLIDFLNQKNNANKTALELAQEDECVSSVQLILDAYKYGTSDDTTNNNQ